MQNPTQMKERPQSIIDHRRHPELYRIGLGEQGVLTIEPYKSELLPQWRFKTPEIAQQSAQKIYRMFKAYRTDKDFVGMDMARKYLQMGFTRARRYANHKNGQKYDEAGNVLPDEIDEQKAEAARIFYDMYLRAKNDPYYIVMKARHKRMYDQ